jgi:ABC-type phosphate transport system auxiliary subunit
MAIGHLVRRANAQKREAAIMEGLEETFRQQYARVAKRLQQRVRRHQEKLEALDAIDAGELVNEPDFIRDQCDIDIRK